MVCSIIPSQPQETGKVYQQMSWCLQWRSVDISEKKSSCLVVEGEGDMKKMVKGDFSSSPCDSPWISAVINAEFRPFLSVPPPDQEHCSLLSGCKRQAWQIWLFSIKENICSPWVKSSPVAIHLTSDKLPSRTAAKSKKKNGIKKKKRKRNKILCLLLQP